MVKFKILARGTDFLCWGVESAKEENKNSGFSTTSNKTKMYLVCIFLMFLVDG